MLHLDCNTQDVAVKLFEQFREDIREKIKETPSNVVVTPRSIYYEVVSSADECIHLYNCVETFRFLDEAFYKELEEEILYHIEGEIEA